MILAIFDQQVDQILPTKFLVKAFPSGEEVQNRFPRQRPWRHLGFLTERILALFYLQVTLMLPTKFRVNWGSVQEKK